MLSALGSLRIGSARLLSSVAAPPSVADQLRHRMGKLPAEELSEGVKRALSLTNANRQELINYQITEAVKQFGRFPGDTGYTPVQVAVLTAKIDGLRSHMASNHKDVHSKRGLNALVTRRRKLLQYIEKKDFDAYAHVIKSLKLKPVS
jgi:small subunit ribosomal protein S15